MSLIFSSVAPSPSLSSLLGDLPKLPVGGGGGVGLVILRTWDFRWGRQWVRPYSC